MTLKDRIEKAVALGLLKLPAWLLGRLAGKPIVIDGYTLDPVVQFLTKSTGDAPGHIPPREVMRADFDLRGNWFTHPPHPDVAISELKIVGRHGPIPCELYRPKNLPSLNAPMLMFFHGGGHVAGSLTSHRDVARQLAFAVNCLVLAVDYRLAPEHKFPIGIEDCLDAYDYATFKADALGIDPDRISVGGDSAGGNCAAVIAQQRRSAKHPPKFQMLWVPWVDMSAQAHSYHSMGEGFFLGKATMEWYTAHYLRDEDDALNPLASPLLGDVEGVCPAALLVAGFDPLRDEGLAYAKKLKDAGVPTTLRLMEGTTHPFINVAGKVPIASEAFDEAVRLLRANG